MSMSEIQRLITGHGHNTDNTDTNNGCSSDNSCITEGHHHEENHE